MDMKLEAALALINELQEENHDKEVLIDLLYEDINDLKNQLRSATGQLAQKNLDCTYAVG